MEEVMPVGSWPKDKNLKLRGHCFLAQFLDLALDSYTVALFTRFGGWKAEDVRAMLTEVKKEVRSNRMHLYTHWYVFHHICSFLGIVVFNFQLPSH
jgi:hypothetical protein